MSMVLLDFSKSFGLNGLAYLHGLLFKKFAQLNSRENTANRLKGWY